MHKRQDVGQNQGRNRGQYRGQNRGGYRRFGARGNFRNRSFQGDKQEQRSRSNDLNE